MPLYKLTKGSIGIVVENRETVEVKKGQTVELPEEKAKSYSKYLKRVDQPTNEQTTVTTTSTTTTDWSETQNMKATDVIDLVKDTDSIDELNDLQGVEERGQNRVGVLNAIEKRIRQLEEEV